MSQLSVTMLTKEGRIFALKTVYKICVTVDVWNEHFNSSLMSQQAL